MIPLATQYSFHDSFWTSTPQHEPLPKFSQGLSVLHSKLAQSMEENNTIIHYLSKRIQAEKQYAQYLDTILDDSNMMSDIFELVITESKSSAEAHLSRANNLITTALDPVERMAAKYTKIITTSKAAMTTFIDQFDTQAQITMDAQQDYNIKCKRLLANDPSYRPTRDETVTLANKSWNRNDLVVLLDRLQQNHQPLLGQNILDEMMARYAYCNDSSESLNNATAAHIRESATLACQDLLAQNWIAAFTTAGTTNTPEDNGGEQVATFTTGENTTYTVIQHTRTNYGHLNNASNSDLGSSADDLSSTSSALSSSSSLGFWSRQRWTSLTPKQSNYQQLCRDMETADQHYKQAVHKAESLRMEIEENLFMHFDEMESLELERIQTLKQAFISMAAAFSNTIPIYKDTYDRMMLYQETLQPDKDIQVIVEQYRTSKFCPRPILYENYFSGVVSEQLFGAPIENVVEIEKTHVPLLIVNGLAVIESELPHLHNEERKKIWTTPLPLDLIHNTRNELNRMNGVPISQETLKKHNILLLASVLWLYLLELPDCLVTFELYDTIKLLYGNQNQQDNDCHLASLGKLMTTLPSANYETLKTLLYHLKRVIEAANESSLIQVLISRFTQIIIRPDLISAMNRHDRHPHRFVRDLLEHMDIIFSKEVDQGQHNHHLRQQQRPAQPPESPTSSLELHNKLPSLDSSSMASTTSTPNRYSDDLLSPDGQQNLLKEKSNGHGIASITTPPVRRRSLMSFVRRSSSTTTTTSSATATHDTSYMSASPSGCSGLISAAEALPTRGAIHSSTRRPLIPMPSTSTLFEDPEEIDMVPPGTLFTAPPPKMSTNHDNAASKKLAPELDKLLLQSRISSSTTDDDDDHISLDSFFL
ncbi:hypothetical protein BCR42DRAFT_400630 [Absidia repens]|uniref:Rho-GAP domain-containing protein n=1 Tax=Absidia repens TaxID=90262 RepID=A0A1X2J1I0_9FUNG|nr:hypothetical protein BCR42DRAFT_400630 [Absidia repens]